MRYHKMTNFLTGLFLICLISVGYSQTVNVSGYVYWDANQNQQRDARETGVEGVLVSNQVQVIKTDRDGRYQIDITEGNVLFVTKPAGYNLPLTPNNLPRFFYIYSPKGSPDLKYEGLPPSGDLPEEINFPLYKSMAEDS